MPRFGTPFCGDLFSKISTPKVKIFLFLERVALSRFACTLITSFLSRETFPFAAGSSSCCRSEKVAIEAKLTPEVAIWAAAAVVVSVVSSALLQAVSAAAKGIAQKKFYAIK